MVVASRTQPKGRATPKQPRSEPASPASVPQQQGRPIDPDKVIAKMRNVIGSQTTQIAMLETVVEDLEEEIAQLRASQDALMEEKEEDNGSEADVS